MHSATRLHIEGVAVIARSVVGDKLFFKAVLGNRCSLEETDRVELFDLTQLVEFLERLHVFQNKSP